MTQVFEPFPNRRSLDRRYSKHPKHFSTTVLLTSQMLFFFPSGGCGRIRVHNVSNKLPNPFVFSMQRTAAAIRSISSPFILIFYSCDVQMEIAPILSRFMVSFIKACQQLPTIYDNVPIYTHVYILRIS